MKQQFPMCASHHPTYLSHLKYFFFVRTFQTETWVEIEVCLLLSSISNSPFIFLWIFSNLEPITEEEEEMEIVEKHETDKEYVN